LVYYNENDPLKAAWLRELINQDLIAKGHVDDRSIESVSIGDLRCYNQCHFFAGIGVWSYALRLAGWPDDRPVWTASCPCQPFSQAGRGGGFDDARHLWPTLSILVQLGQPGVVFGEQVSSQDGLAWFDSVSDDLEREAYTIGALDTTACSVGAGHVRNRLYWAGWLADTARKGLPERLRGDKSGEPGSVEQPERFCSSIRVDDAESGRRKGRYKEWQRPRAVVPPNQESNWVLCRPLRAGDPHTLRPIEPGSTALAYGVAERVGLIRGYGDAINAHQAAAWIETVMEEIDK